MKSVINDVSVTHFTGVAEKAALDGHAHVSADVATPGGLCGHCLAEHLVELAAGAVFDLDDARAVRRLADAGLLSPVHDEVPILDRAS